MEALNLFGVPIQVEQQATSKEQAAKKKFVADLIDMLTDLDNLNEIEGVGLTQDFTTAKSLVSYDLSAQFGEEAHKDGKSKPPVTDHRALVYEDSMRLRSSIIINAYQRQLDDIDYDSLTFQEQESYTRVKNLLTYLKNVKVIDAPVLLKIYRLYAQKY